MPPISTKQIVIIGGGFAGISLIKRMAGKAGFRVTLVDRNNYSFFPPLLYQIATGFLQVSNISYPFRKFIRKKANIRFHMGEFLKLIPSENIVVLSTGQLKYDYLVFATGVSTNYFGLDNVKKYAMPMKNVHDALELRNHLLQQVEMAATVIDELEKKKLLTIVIAGGGPTGVEISGMLADMGKYILPKDYPEIRGSYGANIYLVNSADRVLKPMSKKSQDDTLKALSEMGVQVMLNMQVKDYIRDTVIFSNGETIETKTLIWAAGVIGSVYDGIPVESYGSGKRLIVNEYNEIKGLNSVFAIGDVCLQNTEAKFPIGHPQLAQVAIQQGRNLACNIQFRERGKKLRPFSYFDKGSMAIIGRNRAVVDLPGNKTHFKGFIAWFIWLFVHLLTLVTYSNRVATLYNWIVAYFTRDQSLRMIIRPLKNK